MSPALLGEALHPPPRGAAHLVLGAEEEAVDLDERVLVELVELADDAALLDELAVGRHAAVGEEVDRVDERILERPLERAEVVRPPLDLHLRDVLRRGRLVRLRRLDERLLPGVDLRPEAYDVEPDRLRKRVHGLRELVLRDVELL